MRKATLILAILIIFPLFIFTAIGQPPPPEPEATPIDGGLLALLIAGAVYGGKKFFKNKNQETE